LQKKSLQRERKLLVQEKNKLMLSEFSDYFRKVSIPENLPTGSIGTTIRQWDEPEIGSPQTQEAKIALIGISDFSGNGREEPILNPLNWREGFYRLFPGESFNNSIFDLGDFVGGKTQTDTHFAIAEITEALLKKNVFPIFIGGANNHLLGIYNGYEKLEQTVNIGLIDYRADIGDTLENVDDFSFLTSIILKNPNYLFNLSLIGYQTYLCNKDNLNLFDKLHFDRLRLGELRPSIIARVEPQVRACDVISIDFSSVKQADFKSGLHMQPNGLTSEEICQIARYCGFSEKLTALHLAGFAEVLESKTTDKHLIGQVLWCFLDGFYNRKKDFPQGSKQELKKYLVAIKESESPLIFYKSNKTDRWWMEVPFVRATKKNYESHAIVPCSYQDYLNATQNEIPDAWIKTAEKLK
jgi:formiminoglutamase